MGLVEKYVKDRIAELDYAKIPKPIKFSVSIDNDTNFRLQYIAKILETSRATLSADFIQMAIVDAEKALGLNPFDFESEYSKALMESCGGAFIHDDTGYYRVTSSGEKIKVVDTDSEDEINYKKNSIQNDKEEK
ncbi:hypothetical protein [Bacillus sp. OK048]|uniref:hypothetical protein n=1 Tax=Bacillus sp. OK048 TaxID=1882761 RepID=UPI000880D686|nr:hypothetical protein [Bacillus sp. OK048]SDN62471.1 hypothetical protein SAMN05443253_11531 [Bacillus sp. OK048]